MKRDTTPPVLTITQGGTFTDTQTVTMTTNENATIYYTLDGTEPTTSSPVYSAPLTLTDTTTVKAFARDPAGNESAVQTVTYTKTAELRNYSDGLVLHYDFTNKAGTNSNTITDKVNNVPATLSVLLMMVLRMDMWIIKDYCYKYRIMYKFLRIQVL